MNEHERVQNTVGEPEQTTCGRRRFLLGLVAAGLAYSMPTLLGLDEAEAEPRRRSNRRRTRPSRRSGKPRRPDRDDRRRRPSRRDGRPGRPDDRRSFRPGPSRRDGRPGPDHRRPDGRRPDGPGPDRRDGRRPDGPRRDI